MGPFVADDQIEYQHISNKIKKEVERVVQIFSHKDRFGKVVRDGTLTVLACDQHQYKIEITNEVLEQL